MRIVISCLAILVVAGVTSRRVYAQAACQLLPASAETLTSLANVLSGSALERQQGLVYLDAGCLAEARHAFEQSRLDAKDTAEFSLPAQQNLAEYLLELTDGYEALRSGNLAKAKEILVESSDEARPNDVNVRAVFALAELLLQNPDPVVWKNLEPKLAIFDESGLWKARRYRMMYGLTPANADERIAFLQSRLDADLPVAARLEDETILAEVLAGVGRFAEAELLTRDIEADVGQKAVAVDLRAQYVQVCTTLAKHQVESGDLRAQPRLEKYQSALREIYAPQ